ncbi:hypothetical protein N7532_002510 [Penicillium argentinense]|uniref:UvrD-like helicase ATP-binding domain-containing protein n=1 Tax=Penicillium argentinense TaxID=1131581 RepID=A0A9W9G1H1_9EURO|nr:uncharacterized protein N7532_002510 [Penicillium argentinense]KAJ5109865.1 hypothetical protein N7532_002510 [Penicillium argentinense]
MLPERPKHLVYHLLTRTLEPDPREIARAAASIDDTSVALPSLMEDPEFLDITILNPGQACSRLHKIFQEYTKGTSTNGKNSTRFIQQFLLPLLHLQDLQRPFSLDEMTELIGGSLTIMHKHSTRLLRAVFTEILKCDDLFESLIASKDFAHQVIPWFESKKINTVFGQELGCTVAGRVLRACNACPGDHGTRNLWEDWVQLERLKQDIEYLKPSQGQENQQPIHSRGTLPVLSQMRPLNVNEKKAHGMRHDPAPRVTLSSSIEKQLEALHIQCPEGTQGWAQMLKQVDDKAPELIEEAMKSFPCRLCSERLQGHALAPAPVDAENPLAVIPTEERIDLYGERIGHWKVLLSDLAMMSIKALVDSDRFGPVEKALRSLAQGKWGKTERVPCGSDKDRAPRIPIFRTDVRSELFIIWQIDFGYYDDSTARDKFGQTMKIWDIKKQDDLIPTVDRVINLQQHYKPETVARCQMKPIRLPNNGAWVPLRWDALPVYSAMNRLPDQIDTNQISIELLSKSTNVSESFLEAFSRGRGPVEFPFDLSYDEMAIVGYHNTSSMILGRSGTGKTTCLLYKLFGKYKARELTQPPRSVKQLLLTRSPLLAAKLQIYLRTLIDTATGTIAEPLSEDLQPVDILRLHDIHFPFVCTYDKFLEMVESSIKNQDRQNFAAGDTSKEKGKFRPEDYRRKAPVIDYHIFKNEYWGGLSMYAPAGCSVELAFAEIMGVIRGSRSCAQELRPLTRDEYMEKGAKASPTSPSGSEREKIYDVHERYERLKKQRCQLDDLDRVMTVLTHIIGSPNFAAQLRNCFEEIYVDEIQDLRCADIVLLFKSVFNARGIHLAGDTAQCISKDAVFSFPEIKAAFFDEHQSTAAFLNQDVARPSTFTLGRNYRSHQGILSFASWVMRTLWTGFPETVDKLAPETGLIDGPRPIIFAGFDSSVLTARMMAGNRTENVANFGAEQVILVRDEEAKSNLQTVIGDIALVLTILESKGMEFDDVVIYDYFSGSALGSSYRNLHQLVKEPRGSFDSRKNAQLYVAVTRPRKQLWILESNESSLEPIIKALTESSSLDLVDLARKGDGQSSEKLKVIQERRSVDVLQWQKRANDLFNQKNFESAIFCYRKAGDGQGAAHAKALEFESQARRHKFSDLNRSVSYMEEAISCFRQIGLLEKAADCYEDIGMHDQAAGELFVAYEAFMALANIHAEIWKNKGQLKRAASLFEAAKRYKAASECHDADGDFLEAVEVLHRGSEFDEVILYLIKNPKNFDVRTRQRYSRLCNILLKQGRISSELREATINLLGSAEEKIAFFKEFDMAEQLRSFYFTNGNWLEYYNVLIDSADMLSAVEIVLEHDLIRTIDMGRFVHVVTFLCAESLCPSKTKKNKRGVIEKLETLLEDEDLDLEAPEALRSTLQQWKAIYSLVAPDLNKTHSWDTIAIGCDEAFEVKDVMALVRKSTAPPGKSFRDFLAFHTISLLMNSPDTKTEHLPFLLIKHCGEFVRDIGISDQNLQSLHLICGLYTPDEGAPKTIRLDWSPLSTESVAEGYEATSLISQVEALIRERFSQAMISFDKRARLYLSRHFPTPCFYFLHVGKCQNATCHRSHNKLSADFVRAKIQFLTDVAGVYVNLTKVYYQRQMPYAFQSSFLGRRRYWLTTLEEELNFISPLAQLPYFVGPSGFILLEHPNLTGVQSAWEDLLFYRIGHNWATIQGFSQMLEQLQLARYLGPGTEARYRRALFGRLHRQMRTPGLATQSLQRTLEALKAAVAIYRAAPGVRYHGLSEIREPIVNLTRLFFAISLSDYSRVHSVISVFEVAALALLCKASPGKTVLLPSPWILLHLQNIIGFPIPKDAPELCERERNDYCQLLSLLVRELCRIVIRLLQVKVQTGTTPQNHASSYILSFTHKRRVFDLAMTVIVNMLHWPTRFRGMHGLMQSVFIDLDKILFPVLLPFGLSDEKIKFRMEYRRWFLAYGDKCKLSFVKLDDSQDIPSHLKIFAKEEYRFSRLSDDILVVRNEKDTSLVMADNSDPAGKDEFTAAERIVVAKIQRRWKKVMVVMEERRQMKQTMEGKILLALHKHCQRLLGDPKPPAIHSIQLRHVVFTRLPKVLVHQNTLSNQIQRMKEQLRTLFRDTEMSTANLEKLDDLQSRFNRADKWFSDFSKNFSLEMVYYIIEITSSPIELSETIDETESMLEGIREALLLNMADLDAICRH